MFNFSGNQLLELEREAIPAVLIKHPVPGFFAAGHSPRSKLETGKVVFSGLVLIELARFTIFNAS